MSRSAFRVPLLLLALLYGACTTPTAVAPAPSMPAAAAADIEALLGRMSLEQKVAQVMVIALEGTTFDAEAREMVEKYQVGGIIFFARNVQSPAQVARVTNELQATSVAASGIGLLIAIDQEGGRVARLTENRGFTEFPGGMALGATARDAKQAAAVARRVGAAMGAEMKAVGLNTNFAPDLDVNNNPANPVIGIRSYGSDPQRVAEIGVAFMEGLQGNGVLAFGKHFPGHGDTAVDSHADLPIVAHTRARLDAVEFVPFKAAIAKNIAGIMSAHVSFPTIDPTPGLPGTLSSKVLTDLLRKELHFDGLVATDSLEMGALGKSGFPAPKAASRALQSGADLLLFNAGHKLHQTAIQQVVADVRSGVIPLARLDEAVRRALRAKVRFGLIKPALVDPAAATQVAGSAANKALARETAAAAITLLRDDAARLPLASGKPVVVIAVAAAAGLGEALHAAEVRIKDVPADGDTAAALKAVREHPGAPVIITLSGARPNSGQSALARKVIESGAPVVLIAVREPYDLLSVPTPAGAKGPTLLATYGVNPATLEALAAVLRGTAKPAGHLPVDLPGLFPLGAGLGDFVRR
jgi:beta-N-acetylhexosaminidase